MTCFIASLLSSVICLSVLILSLSVKNLLKESSDSVIATLLCSSLIQFLTLLSAVGCLLIYYPVVSWITGVVNILLLSSGVILIMVATTALINADFNKIETNEKKLDYEDFSNDSKQDILVFALGQNDHDFKKSEVAVLQVDENSSENLDDDQLLISKY